MENIILSLGPVKILHSILKPMRERDSMCPSQYFFFASKIQKRIHAANGGEGGVTKMKNSKRS